MNEIKLKRAFGKKIIAIAIFSFMILIVTHLVAKDIFLINFADGLSFGESIYVVVIGVVTLIVYLFLCSLILSSSLTRLSEEGIWQFQVIRPVFIPWRDIQKLEAELGMRILTSPQGVIQIYLDDFKEPHKLVAAIEARVPSSALTETDSTDL